jgi:hypothetical protein
MNKKLATNLFCTRICFFIILNVVALFSAIGYSTYYVNSCIVTDADYQAELANANFSNPKLVGQIDCAISNYTFFIQNDQTFIKTYARISNTSVPICSVNQTVTYNIEYECYVESCNHTSVRNELEQLFPHNSSFPCRVDPYCNRFLRWNDPLPRPPQAPQAFTRIFTICALVFAIVFAIAAIIYGSFLLREKYQRDQFVTQRLLNTRLQVL